MKNVYVISDIHNDRTNFITMLSMIHFDDKIDEMYILGDIFDRGNEAVELYFEILKHPSIHCIRGNHDTWVAKYIMEYLDGKVEYSYRYNTFEQLKKRLTNVDIKNFAKWIMNMPSIINIEIKGERFLFAHEYEEFDTEMALSDFLMNGVPGYTSIIGHTPTSYIKSFTKNSGCFNENVKGDLCIWNNSKSSTNGRVIAIDCGNAYRHEGWGGRLGCLRLNDAKEFYV